MAKFNAGTAVESMDYDFTDFGGSTGTIPEPTSTLVDGFFSRVKALAQEVRSNLGGNVEDLSETEAADALASMDGLGMEDYERNLAEAISDLCQSKPSVEELMLLPFRVRAAFMQWLIGQLRPEAPRPATMR